MNILKDKIRGSLFAGAVGDALGYEIEFMGESEIFNIYGTDGIQEYSLDYHSGNALVSDDTQMTLFTASAMIKRANDIKSGSKASAPHNYACKTYYDWFVTQMMDYNEAKEAVFGSNPTYEFYSDMLREIPELFNRRAPGMTCLSGLSDRKIQDDDILPICYINSKINNSKGCGGVMRVAPIGMMRWSNDMSAVALEGAECSAITHCHSLGYMSGAVLSLMVYQMIYGNNSLSLREIVEHSKETVESLFKEDKHITELIECINNAVELSENNDTDLNNIHKLGEGWVAEEALAIAIYCSLKYQNDLSKAIITAVNHKGDSDSTGAITGNIVGAITGYEAIDQKWKNNLELSETILSVADMIYECSI